MMLCCQKRTRQSAAALERSTHDVVPELVRSIGLLWHWRFALVLDASHLVEEARMTWLENKKTLQRHNLGTRATPRCDGTRLQNLTNAAPSCISTLTPWEWYRRSTNAAALPRSPRPRSQHFPQRLLPLQRHPSPPLQRGRPRVHGHGIWI